VEVRLCLTVRQSLTYIVGAFPIPAGITSFGCPHILVYNDESWSLGTRITLTVFAFLRIFVVKIF